MAFQLYNVRNSCLLIAPIILSTCFLIFHNPPKRGSNIFTINEDITTRPKIEVLQGKLLGINMVTHHGRKIFGFKGIPYAQPPVGKLRFKGPIAADAWNGTFDASRETSMCPQVDGGAIIGDEDCLHLNVYTPRLPAKDTTALLPVIFFVFGGAFKEGHNSHKRWGPYFLLDKDVLLVVPNSRTGVLGYLSTGDEASLGNFGLKDLVQALKWNQENIRYFGGDPDRVTLMGASSGAINAHLLTLSDSTIGLFHQYITQSGSLFFSTVNRPRSVMVNQTTQLGEHFGCPTDTSIRLVSCLRNIDVSRIVGTESLFKKWMHFPIMVWGPTNEPAIDGALLTDTPANLAASGKLRDLPWLLSVTRDEGVIFSLMFHLSPDLFEEFLGNVDTALPQMLQYDSLVGNVTAYTDALKSFYLNDLTANRTLVKQHVSVDKTSKNSSSVHIGDQLKILYRYSYRRDFAPTAQPSSMTFVNRFGDWIHFQYIPQLEISPIQINPKPLTSADTLLANYTQLVMDAFFAFPAFRSVQQQLLVYGKNTTYLASYEYRGTFSYTYKFGGGSLTNYGVCHGDEILYLFKNLNTLFGPPDQKMNEADLQIVDAMVQLWTSFVINGTPTADPISSVIWEPYSARNNYLRIGSDSHTSLEMKYNFLENRIQFWEDLIAATSWKKPF